MSESVLLVDDDPSILRLVEHYLASEGLTTTTVTSGSDALKAAETGDFAAVVLDLVLPDVRGRDVLAELHEHYVNLPVIILTAHSEVSEVVECMRLGAVDFVQKPVERTRLLTSVRNAVTQRTLLERVQSLSSELRKREGFAAVIGSSPAIREAVHLLARAATSDVTVLLEGESGTGKEVAARAIHSESIRRDGPFVAVNCGAIPEGLIESELFGHERGAFTGAIDTRQGSFEQAEGGTIFLDEIGELRPDLQVRLLRVLQERRVQRVGGKASFGVDVRVIAATNRDSKRMVAAGEFREDLYYRLAVFPVIMPALRERDGDILILASSFVERFARADTKQIRGVSASAQQALERYDWPGNVRELENVIERAIILEDSDRIQLSSLPEEIRNGSSATATGNGRMSRNRADAGLGDQGREASAEAIVPLEEEERRIICRALELTNWNVQEASRRLHIGRATIYRKIERYGLKHS